MKKGYSIWAPSGGSNGQRRAAGWLVRPKPSESELAGIGAPVAGSRRFLNQNDAGHVGKLTVGSSRVEDGRRLGHGGGVLRQNFSDGAGSLWAATLDEIRCDGAVRCKQGRHEVGGGRGGSEGRHDGRLRFQVLGRRERDERCDFYRGLEWLRRRRSWGAVRGGIPRKFVSGSGKIGAAHGSCG